MQIFAPIIPRHKALNYEEKKRHIIFWWDELSGVYPVFAPVSAGIDSSSTCDPGQD